MEINLSGEIDLDSFVSYEEIEKAEQYREEGDIVSILFTMHWSYTLDFVNYNRLILKDCDLYEEALLTAYTCAKINWSDMSLQDLNLMFSLADRNKLLSSGDPLPDNEPFIIYRGVSGTGSKRRVRGISWTSSFDRAKWFATRFPDQANPAVFQLSVLKDDIYAYSNAVSEEEFLIDVGEHLKPIKVWDTKMEILNNETREKEKIESIKV